MLLLSMAVINFLILVVINSLLSLEMIAGNNIPNIVDIVIIIVNVNSSLFCFSFVNSSFIDSPLYYFILFF